ncbi:kelch-like protein 10 [Mugil cephalus]|uniref:kelch-like protein 10 n=1 Tax=Mugil cephalus TaxID=48193 RepID=UPI001FB58B20|nr:kelch-like protein 10 [Mugil cephalus]
MNAVFAELLQEQKLCDSVIRAGEVEFKVHRIILCSCSSYFRDLFCNELSTSEQKVYSFPDVSPSVMSLILDYAYTHSVGVTKENVLELLAEADRLAVKDVAQACCDFLEQKLCFENCINVWKFAERRNYPDLREKAYLYILHHFVEVAGLTSELLQLPVGQLAELIEKDELNVMQESIVFEAILSWIDYASEERRGHMATLLRKVRLLLMPIEYLVNNVSRNDLVKKSRPCLAMVRNAIKTLRVSKMERPLTRPRLPSDVLLAIGGWEINFPTNKVELYNVRADRWVTLTNRQNDFRVFHGCVYLSGFVYCVGGFDSVNYLSSVQKFNLATQTWQEVGSMHEARCCVSVVSLKGCIYAMGGCDRHVKFNSAERYEPSTNQWTLIAPMHEQRSDAGAATLHGKVYICGGLNVEEPLASAECYNPDTNQWTLITPMETRRSGMGVVAYNGQIYVVGGHNGVSQVCSATAYDPVAKHWRMVPPMFYCRSSFGIAVLEDQIYVAGGFNRNLICSVERYDAKANRWHIVRDMLMPRSAMGCCVVKRTPFTATCL